MAKITEGMILTDTGRDMLALAMTGLELKFTRGEAGDGLIGSGITPEKFEHLISPKKTLPIHSIRTSKTGICECVMGISNRELTSGFWLREYGLYALHPQSKVEMLYAYCNKGDAAGYLDGYDGIDFIDFALTLHCVVDNAPNVTANITVSNSYVTATRLEGRIHDMFADTRDLAGVWTFGTDTGGRLCPVSLGEFRKQLFGTDNELDLAERINMLEELAGSLLFITNSVIQNISRVE